MSEIRTNLTISGESSEYRSNLQISVVTLNSNLVDTQSSFRTNLNIVSSLDGKTTTTLNTTLKLENTALDFYLVDMTKMNQSMLYFSKFFNMYFEPEVMWEFLAKGTNEQINISHLSDALSVFSTKVELAQISSSINAVGTSINQHILNSNIHLTQEEKTFISEIMDNPPWGSNDNRSGLFEYVNVGNASNVIWAARPIKYENKDVGIVSNTFISCKGVDVTAGSGGGGITRADLFAILSGEPIDTNEYINTKYLRLDENLKDYAKRDWVELTFIKEETDPTVPVYVKNITEKQILSWDLVASLFKLSADGSYIITNENRGFVSTSFISCKGVDISAPESGSGIDMSLIWYYLGQEGIDQINKSHLIEALEDYATIDWVNNQGYLKSFVEQDPTVPNHVKLITEDEITNWNLVSSIFSLSKDSSYVLVENNRGLVSNSFISCKGLDETAPQVGGTFDRESLFNILSGEPQDGEFINLKYIDLSNYATTDFVISQGYITSKYLTGYATEQWVKQQGYLTQHQDLSAYAKSADVANTYATKTALQTLQNEHNALSTKVTNLDNLLNSDVSGVINTWGEVVDFLDEYSGSEDLATILAGMNNDIANRVLIEDFEKLEDSVSGIAGYFTNGSANNALKLGGQLPSYYATVDALNIVKNDVTAVSNRVQKFEDIIDIDKNGDVYIKGTRNFYTEGGTIGMAGLGSGGSGGGGAAGLGSVTVRVNGQDYITDASGIVTLPNYPSLAGYATESWVGNNYLPLSGGKLTGWLQVESTGTILACINTAGYTPYINFRSYINGVNTDLGDLGVDTDKTLKYYNGGAWRTILHSGNYSSYALPLSGGTIEVSNVGNFSVYNNSQDLSVIHFYALKNGSKTDIGYLGVTANYEPIYMSSGGAQYPLIHSGNIGSQSVNYATSAGNAEKVGGVPVTSGDNKPWGTIPAITPYGYMDVGRHFEFHYDNTTGSDFSTVLGCTGNYGNIVNLPSASGTLALLTDNVASADYATNAGNSDLFDGRDSGGYGHCLLNELYGEDINTIRTGFRAGKVYAMSNAVSDSGYRGLLEYGIDGYVAQFSSDSLNKLYYRWSENSVWKSWRTFAFEDSNVASATKLQTARTIWGQSFDGTDNVSGILKDVGGITFTSNNSCSYDANGNVILNSGNGTYWYVGKTDGTECLVVDSNSGNVLVGTTTNNGAKLQIHNTSGSQSVRINSTVNEWGFDYNNIGVYHNDTLKLGFGWNSEPKSASNTGAYFKNYVSGATISLFNEGGIYFSDNILIGTTEDNGYKVNVKNTATASYDLHTFNSSTNSSFYVGFEGLWYGTAKTSGQIFAIMSGCAYDGGGGNIVFQVTAEGNLTVTGDITSEGTIAMARLASSSDRKLKENIKWLSADKSMEVVRALRPTEWNWKKDGTHSFGFIAQDVQPIVPEMVVNMEHLHLEYNQLHAFEIGAIKHIDSEVDKLKKDLVIANGRIEVLENELKQYRRNA